MGAWLGSSAVCPSLSPGTTAPPCSWRGASASPPLPASTAASSLECLAVSERVTGTRRTRLCWSSSVDPAPAPTGRQCGNGPHRPGGWQVVWVAVAFLGFLVEAGEGQGPEAAGVGGGPVRAPCGRGCRAEAAGGPGARPSRPVGAASLPGPPGGAGSPGAWNSPSAPKLPGQLSSPREGPGARAAGGRGERAPAASPAGAPALQTRPLPGRPHRGPARSPRHTAHGARGRGRSLGVPAPSLPWTRGGTARTDPNGSLGLEGGRPVTCRRRVSAEKTEEGLSRKTRVNAKV